MRSTIRFTGVALLLAPTLAAAQGGGDFELGVRGAIRVADGEPANDITGYGVMFRYFLDDGWALGAAVDANEFDFEQPARLLGIEQSDALEAIDAKAESTDVSVHVERHRAWSERWSWFWQAGLGIGNVDVPDVAGPRADGGSFRIETETSSEPFALAGLGARSHAGPWRFEGALTLQYRFADYAVVDTVSGQTGTVDDYLATGLYLGVLYRF